MNEHSLPSDDPLPPKTKPSGFWHLFKSMLKEGDCKASITDLMQDSNDESPNFTPHERMLIANVLEVRNLTASDLMIPRADMICIPIKASLDELLEKIAEHPHSRMPVYRDSMDDIIGVVHMKDILSNIARKNDFKVEEHLREIMIIAPSMHALDLLLEMRKTRLQIAAVVDEYGGIDGMLTIEDLVEGIVGEIEDEWESAEVPQAVEEANGTVLADARLPIVDFERRVGTLLDEEEREDIDTLGGFIAFMEGRVPARGELVKHPSGLEFEIVDADPRRIKKIRIRNVPPLPENDEEADQF